MTAVISFVVYIPVRVIKPAHRCLPFVLVFLEQGQPRLAMAAVIILAALLLLLVMGMLIVGYDTGMFKRTPAPSRDADAESGPLYVQSQHKRNPDRKLIYYGVPLAIQYVSPPSSHLISGFTPSKLHFGCCGNDQYPSQLHGIRCTSSRRCYPPPSVSLHPSIK
jgi:hypothetical protein